MRARGRGRFGTIASIGGLVSVPHLSPYSTAKFGAVGFTNGLRAELAGTGVTATTVAPGLMRTGSHLKAEFTGDAAAEYAWFAPGASMPLVSMDAERAAAKIVSGILSGRSIVILTPLAKVGARIQGVAPATTAAVMGLAARLLPAGPGAPTATIEGHDARRRLDSRLVERLTTWGNRAAARNNEGPPDAASRHRDRRSVGRRGPQPFPDGGALRARRGQQVQDEVVVLVGRLGLESPVAIARACASSPVIGYSGTRSRQCTSRTSPSASRWSAAWSMNRRASGGSR